VSETTATPQQLLQLQKQLKTTYKYFVGFPGATDFAYKPLYPFFDFLLNNVGDPFDIPYPSINTKQLEQQVITFFADLFAAPPDDRWGYVTAGGSEGNMYAMYLGRELLPGARVYASQAAHYSIAKNAHILQMPCTLVKTAASGELDYDDLAKAIAAHPGRPAIVVATIGTTMTEARDNVAMIKKILIAAKVPHFIHSDAALAGVYAALLPSSPFSFADGADSINISGHKFIGSPMPCGIVIARKSYTSAIARSGYYTASADTTISGSRSGHAPLFLWYAIQRFGIAGLKKRAQKSMQLAQYTLAELHRIGWDAWRNPNSLTVVLAEPPRDIVAKWQLATQDGWSHIICMPGVTKARVNAFIADLAGH
jgi:histidine decarboxylase